MIKDPSLNGWSCIKSKPLEINVRIAIVELVTELLDASAIQRRLQGLPHWQLDGGKITRVVNCADFAAALDLVNKVGALAEEANHHPDIEIRWNRVTLHLTTHSQGGLTVRDFDVAAAINHIGHIQPK